jgi:CHASE2 domain-containing protein
MAEPANPAPAPTPTVAAGVAKKLAELALAAVPTLLITQAAGWINGKLFAQPWQMLCITLPLTGLVVFAWRTLRKPQAPRIDLRFAIFLGLFATLFGVLSATDLLVWKRTAVAGLVESPGRNWLLPVSWGDWRYRLVRGATPASRLIVMLQEPHDDQNQERTRLLDARVAQAAAEGGALGVFFDVSYTGRSALDERAFCPMIEAASAGIPVITAYHLVPVAGSKLYEAAPPADPALTPGCLLERRDHKVYRGHSMVLADVDGTVRTIPVTWLAAAERSALSVRIAQCMKSACGATDLKLPDGELLRFLPGAESELNIVEGDDAIGAAIASPGRLQGQYLLVGERSPRDRFRTPGNDATPGTLIHAWAVNSLLSGVWFTRPPAWVSGFVIIAACGILSIFALSRSRPWLLLVVAVVESVAIAALAALAAKSMLVWIDVIYALVALWLLLPLLLVYRKLAAPKLAQPVADDHIELIDPDKA